MAMSTALNSATAVVMTDYGIPASTARSVYEAKTRLAAARLRRTELRQAHTIAPGFNLVYKCELDFWTGSFKERGALNFLLQLSPEEKKRGVIAASAGNHALALAYHGNRLGIPVSVVMPLIAPMTKVNRCVKYKANVISFGADISVARQHALTLVGDATRPEYKQVYVNGFDDPRIVDGAGTCGLEIIEDAPDVDAIVVPIGGGGLVAGICLAVKHRHPAIKIIGVESDACPSFAEALKAGKPVPVKTKATLADGLKVPQVGAHSFAVCRDLLDAVIVIEEKFVALGIVKLLET